MTAASQATPSRQHPQKYLGAKGLIILIALLSAFVPLSTDLYLPALPRMSDFFQVSAEKINLTLTMFFVFYSLGTLLWGPFSDRFGRKPVLLLGLTVYLLASALSAVAWNVEVLILARILQAAGGSAAGAVATAVVKDVYAGRQRERVLAIVQSMTMISPMVAPIIGALLLGITTWRGVFWALAVIGGLALLGSAMMEETIEERTSGMVLHSLGRLGKVLQNKSFTMLLLLFSLGGISGMAYVAGSTFIYQEGFGLSSQAYSFYFAVNALGTMSGPIIFLRISRYIHSETIIRWGFIFIAASGILICLLGNLAPWVFVLCLLPSSIAGSCMRAPSTNLMLEQQKGDTGSVSSVMGCTGLLFGSLGMQLISLEWSNMIITLGVMMVTTATLSLLFWPLAIQHAKRFPRMDTISAGAGGAGQ